ncbi:MAG: hypothetical protein V4549_17925 [Bacteroidota bacterium]
MAQNQNTSIANKDEAWFTSNGEITLELGIQVYLLQTGFYKIGDGTTKLSSLVWLGGLAPARIILPVYYYLVGDLDYWNFSNQNRNNNIDLGSFTSPLNNFFMDWLRF